MDPGVIFNVDPFRLHRCLLLVHPPAGSGISAIHLEPDLPIGNVYYKLISLSWFMTILLGLSEWYSS